MPNDATSTDTHIYHGVYTSTTSHPTTIDPDAVIPPLDKTCRVIRIPKKKKGAFRTIYAPRKTYKNVLRTHIDSLEAQFRKLDGKKGCGHGFSKNRSPVTNAKAHCGFRFTVSMDLEDFFDHVTVEKLQPFLDADTIDLITVDGAARQGLPTSPAAANIAAVPMDRAIKKFLKSLPGKIVYTRYADDLSFSFHKQETIDILKREIPRIVQECGWGINPGKTRHYDSKYVARRVCGINSNRYSITVPRNTRRYLRALHHQLRTGNYSKQTLMAYENYCQRKTVSLPLDSWVRAKTIGVHEWTRLVPPDPNKPQDKI